MPTELITPFDVADYQETGEDIRLFIKEAAETGSAKDFIQALNTAARAKGMTEIAKQIGVTRASLYYKSLADGGNPRFETIAKIVEALGCKLVVS